MRLIMIGISERSEISSSVMEDGLMLQIKLIETLILLLMNPLVMVEKSIPI